MAANTYHCRNTVEAMQWFDTDELREEFATWYDDHDLVFETFGPKASVDEGHANPGEWVVWIGDCFTAFSAEQFEAEYAEGDPEKLRANAIRLLAERDQARLDQQGMVGRIAGLTTERDGARKRIGELEVQLSTNSDAYTESIIDASLARDALVAEVARLEREVERVDGGTVAEAEYKTAEAIATWLESHPSWLGEIAAAQIRSGEWKTHAMYVPKLDVETHEVKPGEYMPTLTFHGTDGQTYPMLADPDAYRDSASDEDEACEREANRLYAEHERSAGRGARILNVDAESSKEDS